uniref:3-methylcrotonyl-CoA carboxylase alpha subunit n=1 Tax=Tetraselmis sp. GSL018 TaxID=582737 RepID=A0A061QJ99_9CHLO|mmetsp:Transcript_20450/g.48690  ORF Transcript_20450/g.48690 Transcript_20450/m.48690 type:complete len:749 (-) Transcript_20450:264-2510(-)|eukprot:CAMPEP_0177626666 /NCGR_PEP_ID=MMETSP0419_2-20121207/30779_1 /TAXON_ID=582737 /ORGANISM="Tetraselmis sp., Strain GSL018" /LENGTH=748 /DNA_ID=CAMNT_0019127743 /DNA_START=255 /DNA_END=2501 /DNA_ORIENTATION=+
MSLSWAPFVLSRRTEALPRAGLAFWHNFSSNLSRTFPVPASSTHANCFMPGVNLEGKLLIANRGEIACRVLETAHRLKIPTIAVYSDADAESLHVRLADEAVCIGPPAANASYLRGEVVLNLAKSLGAAAVHPGYGFLSENACFADACANKGVKFVGPPASAIRSLGDKREAKEIMSAAGVPVVPGYHGEDQDPSRLGAEAARIGFPLLVKAVMGGGGKGMKLARSAGEFEEALGSAKREAAAAFGDDRVLLERFIMAPRHVEVQVLADGHGNAVHLFERDCSVQRRHQKVLEEAPAPGLTEEFRRRICSSAVAAARAVGYVNAGTVEFIVDTATGEHFFMEMNTRLQVEHPVTEAITGLDLVELQLRVAAGERLPFSQEDLRAEGHAIEARLYAENPARDFLPASGTLARWEVPAGWARFGFGSDVRIDTGVQAGEQVGTHYDPMIAKVVARGADRMEAAGKLADALSQLRVAGLQTNTDFATAVLRHPDFLAGNLTTNFIAEHRASLDAALKDLPWEALGLAALSRILRDQAAGGPAPGMAAWYLHPHRRLNGAPLVRSLVLTHPASGTAHQVRAVFQDGDIHLSGRPTEAGHGASMEWSAAVSRAVLEGDTVRAEVNGRLLSATAVWLPHTRTIDLWWNGSHTQLAVPTRADAAAAAAGSSGGGSSSAVVSPLPGKVLRVLVAEGQTVQAGEAVAVVEAMKMEHTLRAPSCGTVSRLSCVEGAQVSDGHTVAVIEHEEVAANACG